MASKSFAINTSPHEAVIGDHTLLFKPEVNGAGFAGAYSGLREAQKSLTDAGDDVQGQDLIAVNEAMTSFLAGFMLDESAKLFATLDLPSRVLVQLIEWVSTLYGSGPGNGQDSSSGES